MFPGEIRPLVGAATGVLLTQQTAANLHAAVGDTVTVDVTGRGPVDVRVDGVVDLPAADSLFQKVGVPPGGQPTATPDNVVLLPDALWHSVFDPVSGSALVTTQIHLAPTAALAADPATAYTQAAGAARNVEAASAGGAVVGDNLGAALGAARSDAAYAQVLFVLLGAPGAVVGGLLTAAVASAGADRRRGEQAMLRLRGATARQVLRLAAAETALVTVVGCGLGLGVAAILSATGIGAALGGRALVWLLPCLVGALVAAVTVLLPAWRDLRGARVHSVQVDEQPVRTPVWSRLGVDLLLVVGAAVLYLKALQSTYTLVLAPEGVPTVAVDYRALAGPVLLWMGLGLLCHRLSRAVITRRGWTRRVVQPVVGPLSATAASMLSRQGGRFARATVVFALALTFAASTATFTATYRQQAEADAILTNGADVTVTVPPGTVTPPQAEAAIAATPGVHGVEPLQHRFAYIGTDLQDLYGVRPESITSATALQDAYFQGGTAAQLMGVLTADPSAILVSAETVKDFQLQPEDTLNLRIQDGPSSTPAAVPFHYAGIVKEFPTAPKDSFFVANADYVASATGSTAAGAYLVDTGGTDTTGVADRLRGVVGTSATVTDIATTRRTVGSSLTSVDLSGLSRIELGFSVVLAVAAGGLVLGLGLAERRRSLAIARLLGARPAQRRSLVVAESALLAVGGLVLGALGGVLISYDLVAMLTGVFDPPPSQLAVPWAFLGTTGLLALLGLAGATAVIVRLTSDPDPGLLRS